MKRGLLMVWAHEKKRRGKGESWQMVYTSKMDRKTAWGPKEKKTIMIDSYMSEHYDGNLGRLTVRTVRITTTYVCWIRIQVSQFKLSFKTIS